MLLIFYIFVAILILTILISEYHENIFRTICKITGSVLYRIEHVIYPYKKKESNYCINCNYFLNYDGCYHKDVVNVKSKTSNDRGKYNYSSYRRPVGIYHIWNRWFDCKRFEVKR